MGINEENEEATRMLNQLIRQSMPRSPNYRYFQDAKQNRYFWTTESLEHEGKKRFVSGVYRYFKGKKHWIAKKKIYHAKRNKAKERALRLLNNATKN